MVQKTLHWSPIIDLPSSNNNIIPTLIVIQFCYGIGLPLSPRYIELLKNEKVCLQIQIDHLNLKMLLKY